MHSRGLSFPVTSGSQPACSRVFRSVQLEAVSFDVAGRCRLCVQATATPQNKGNKGSRTSKTGSSRTGPTSTPTTSPTSSSTPPNVQSAEAQVKAETASPALAQRRAEAQVDTTARRTEAQIDSTADSAKDAAQDTKCGPLKYLDINLHQQA